MQIDICEALNHVRERSWEEIVRKLEGKSLLLYGAGGLGLYMIRALRESNISVTAFLDRRAAELHSVEDTPVFTAEQAPFDRQNCTVLFCILMDKAERNHVVQWLQQLGYSRIIDALSLQCFSIRPDDRGKGEAIEDYYMQRLSLIKQAESLFTEQWSLNVYRSAVAAHATGDYLSCANWESPISQQYFPEGIPLKRGCQRFLDCGGYIGDTVSRLLEREGSIEACAVFEPDSVSFTKMAELLSKEQNSIAERWLYPCAVSDTAKLCGFQSGTGCGSISERGDCVIQTVMLDQSIPDFHPTYIKMDIEGSEPAALRGAKQIISRDKPDLAICVYHAVNHIWDIPLLINSWNLGYRFYLRSYTAYTTETVLYATAD